MFLISFIILDLSLRAVLPFLGQKPTDAD